MRVTAACGSVTDSAGSPVLIATSCFSQCAAGSSTLTALPPAGVMEKVCGLLHRCAMP